MADSIVTIKDPSGRFYAGMTLREAKQNGTDKNFWRRDFSNIDKDRNGVLSVDEIMQERSTIANRCKWSGIVMLAMTAWDLCSHSSRTWKMLDLGLDAYLLYSTFGQMLTINNDTKKYEKILSSPKLNYKA